MRLVDTHCHLDYIAREGADIKTVMADAESVGVCWLVNPSVTPDKFDDVLHMTEQFENVYAAVAVHPTDVQDCASGVFENEIQTMLNHPKVIALGETGLDYYHDTTHVDLQHHFFRLFLKMGRERDLPVIIHDREAHEDVHRLVSEFPGVHGIMHCFSGDTAFAQRMIEKGFLISFAGNLTFKNAHNLHEAARDIPLEHILIETDSPFLSPMPYRGKPNEPARVRFVGEKIAELKNMPVETVAEATTENALKVFKLPC